jgi:succinate dehydrogenase (ubiquinone) membrane anchor subunit
VRFEQLGTATSRSRLNLSIPLRDTDVLGTVNDPTPFPAPNKAHGSYHWTFERLLSASLVPLVGATAVTSVNPILDGILAVAIVAHSHMVRSGRVNGRERGRETNDRLLAGRKQGFDQILIDYLHPRKFPVIGNIAKWLVRVATGGVLVGVYQFNTNDVGASGFRSRGSGEGR